jgi:NAD-dependent deacetylase
MADKIAALGDMLLNANYAIAFTGAGISTESGIPDFRSRGGGLWEKIDPGLMSASTLRTDPALFYRHWREIDGVFAGKAPNRGHTALADLSRLGVLRAVVTRISTASTSRPARSGCSRSTATGRLAAA